MGRECTAGDRRSRPVPTAERLDHPDPGPRSDAWSARIVGRTEAKPVAIPDPGVHAVEISTARHTAACGTESTEIVRGRCARDGLTASRAIFPTIVSLLRPRGRADDPAPGPPGAGSFHAPRTGPGRERDAAPGVRGLRGVRQEVDEGLPQPQGGS